MRSFKRIVPLGVMLAFSAVAVTTASAAETLWVFLPGSVGETLKGEQPGKGTIETTTGKKYTCSKMRILLTDEGLKASSELLKEGSKEGKDATVELVVLHYENCLIEGFLPVTSLGDSAGVVLIHYEVHNCLIKKGEYGLLFLPLALHLEVQVAGLLMIVPEKSSFIAKLEPEAGSKTKFLLSAKQAKGVQGIEKCEGGEKEALKIKFDNEPEEGLGLETSTKLEFDLTKDKEGQTMMEI